MTAALKPPGRRTLGGDSTDIRQSARAWCARASEWSLLADELRAAAPDGFVGDEADSYRAWLTVGLASRLVTAADAWTMVGRALSRYADDLDGAKQRLQAVTATRDSREIAGRDHTVGTVMVDPWVDLAASEALADHADAVTRCRSAIDRARALCPRTAQGPGPIGGIAPWSTRVAVAPDPGPGSKLATTAGSLRTASGLAALAWAAIGSPISDAYPTDGEPGSPVGSTAVTVTEQASAPASGACAGTPPATEPAASTMPSPNPVTSQWPALLGIPPGMSQAPIYDSTTSAPSAPAPTPVPTTAAPPPGNPAPITAPPTSTAPLQGPASAKPSATSTRTAPQSSQPATVQPECIQGDEGYIAKLPRGGPFPFEPKRGQRFSQPQNISREDGNPVDKYGQVWEWKPDQNNGHGEWDVQHGREHTNIDRDGQITHGPNNTGRDPKPHADSADSSYWLDDLLGGAFTVHLDPDQAAKAAALTALAGGAVYIFGGILAGG